MLAGEIVSSVDHQDGISAMIMTQPAVDIIKERFGFPSSRQQKLRLFSRAKVTASPFTSQAYSEQHLAAVETAGSALTTPFANPQRRKSSN
jgi:hypothetical protein